MILNKKRLICFFLIMFITLISCCAISATDNVDSNTTITQNNEVTTNTVEQTEINNDMEKTIASTETSTQSENNNIEETEDKNDVEDENNNAKAINKAKITSTNVKTGTTGTAVSSWSDIKGSGTYYLTNDITATGTLSLSGNIVIDGNGYTIEGSRVSSLFKVSGSNSVSLTNVVITNVNGYVISGGINHKLTSSEFIDNKGIYEQTEKIQNTDTYIINCYFTGCSANAFTCTVSGSQRNHFHVYNSIFKDNTFSIFNTFQHSNFYGYNFIVDNELVIDEDEFYGTVAGQKALAKHAQGEIITSALTSDVNIDITAPDVYVNQTNNIKVRLTANVNGETVGIPNEEVTIKVTYADGTIDNLQCVSNSNGYVHLLNYDGATTVNVTAAKKGIVNVQVIFEGSRYILPNGTKLYTPNSKSQTYNVLKLPTSTVLSLNSTTANIGDSVKLTATVTNTRNTTNIVNSGTVKFYSGTTLLGSSDVSNGKATLDYNVNLAGTNAIKAVYEDENYYNNSNSTVNNLEVTKADSFVDMPNSLTYYVGEKVNIIANVTTVGNNKINSGKVQFTLPNGTTKQESVSDGQAVLTDYTVPSTGNFVIKAKFLADDNYYASQEDQTTITCILIPTTTTIDDISGNVGKTVTITANIKNSSVTGNTDNVPQGTVTFKLNDNVLGTSSVVDGTASIGVVFNSSLSNANIIAYYTNDNIKYADSSSSGSASNLNIAKGETTITVTPTQHGYVDSVVEIEAIVKDANRENIIISTGNININGQSYAIVNGKVVYNYTVTTTSPVSIDSYFEGNDDYEASPKATTIVTKDLIPTVTEVEATETSVGKTVTITANIKNSSVTGNTDNVPQGTVTFKLNDNVLGTSSVVDGTASIGVVFNSSLSNANIIAYYTNDNIKYADSSSSDSASNLNVAKGEAILQVTESIFGIYGEEKTIEAKVVDKNSGNTIKSGTITIGGESKTIDSTTGIATYAHTITESTSIGSSFESDDYVLVENTTIVTKNLVNTVTTVNVPESIVGKTIIITATVKNESDNTNVPQGKVTFMLNDQILGQEEVNDGSASINVRFNHTITGTVIAYYTDENIKYADSQSDDANNLNIAKGEVELQVTERISGSYGESKTITAIVIDKNSNKIITEGNVVIEGKKVEITDSKAQISYSIEENTTVTSSFESDDYEKVENITIVTKGLIPTKLSIIDIPDDIKVGQEFTFNVKLTDNEDNLLDNQIVIVIINNKEVIGLSNTENGVIQVKYTPEDNTTINIDAEFEATSKYDKSNADTYTIDGKDIELIGTKLDITGKDSVIVNEEVIIKINLTDENNNLLNPNNVTVTINDESIAFTDANITDDILTIKYVPTTSDKLTVKANYAGVEGIYSAAGEVSKTIDVKSIPTLATFTVEDKGKVNEELIITVNLTNATENKDVVEGTVYLHINDETIPVNIRDSCVDIAYTPKDNTTLEIYVEYLGDNTYDANKSATKEVPVDLADTSITIVVPQTVKVSEEFQFNITLNDDENKNIPNKSLNVTVNNETITVVYDSENDVYIGKYTPTSNAPIVITAEFGGDNVYHASKANNNELISDKIILIPTKIGIEVPETVKVLNEFEIKLNLTNNTDDLITGKTLHVYVNNEQLSDVILTDGTATVKYTPKNNTALIIKAEFDGDEVYGASRNTNSQLTSDKITLVGTEISIESPENVKVGEEIIVKINLTDDEGNLIDPTNITTALTFNNNPLTEGFTCTVDENKKLLTITYTPQEKGTLNVEAKYSGLEGVYYQAEPKEANVIVNALTDIELNVDLGSLVATNTSNIVITVPEHAKEAMEGQTVYINLTESNGTEHKLSGTINNGQVTIPITPEISGEIVYNVSFVDNQVYDNYNSNDNTDVVNKMPITLEIIGEDEINVGEKYTAEIVFKDANGKDVTEDILYNINGSDYTSLTRDNEGKFILSYDVTTKVNGIDNKGYFDITATISDSDIYQLDHEATKTVTTIGIDTTVVINQDKVTAQRENTATIKLVNTTTGNPISGQIVKVTVEQNGETLDVTYESEVTDEKGNILIKYTPKTTDNLIINAEFTNTEVYNGNSSTKTFKYGNNEEENDFIFIIPTISLTATNTTVYQNNTITATLTDENTPLSNQDVIITVDGESKTYTTDINGQIIITDYVFNTSRIDVEVTAKYDGNITLGYKQLDTKTAEFNVLRINTTITAKPTNLMAGNTTFEIEVQDIENKPVPNGQVILKTGENEYPGTVTNGITTITINNLPKGTYDFTAEYLINDIYYNSSTNNDENIKTSLENIEITGRTANITYTVTNNTYKNTSITVNLYDNITGENLTGETVTAYNQTGQKIGEGTIQENGNVTIKLDLPIGENQPINITYAGNNVYNEVYAEGTIDILKRNSTTTANIVNNIAGNVTLEVTVKDYTTGEIVTSGTINITANDEIVSRNDYEISLENIAVVTNITEKGNYNFIVNFEGNDEYYNSSTLDSESNNVLSNQEVVGRNASMIVDVLNDTYQNVTLNVTVVDATTGEPIVNGTVNVTDKDGNLIGNATTNDEGNAIIVIDVPIGSNDVNVTYTGNETYNPVTVPETVNVQKRNSTTIANVINNTAGNVTLEVKVTDATTGKAITSGYVNITDINTGKVVGRIELNETDNGIVEIVTDITTIDVYDLVANFEGNYYYYNSRDENLKNLEVIGRNATLDAEVTNNTLDNSTVKVQLNDTTTGEPLSNATITIIVNQTTVGNGTTDENGTVIIPVDLPVGEYNITVTYPGNETYNNTNKTVPININPRESTTKATISNNTAGNVTIVANVTDTITGESVPNGPIIVKVNDTVVGTGEVVNGNVTIVTNITEIGTYDIDVVYEGNVNYTGSSDLLEDVDVVGRDSLIVPVVTNATLGNTTVNVTLVDPVTNGTIGNASVVVTLPNGTNFTVVTDENGTVNVTVDLPVGDNNVTITYPGDDTYNGTNVTVPITVEPRASVTSAVVVNNTAGNVTIDVTVADAETGVSVPTGSVDVLVNDTVVGIGEVVDGKVTIVTDIVDGGVYNITVEYKGNENYTGSSDLLEDVGVVGRDSLIVPVVTNATLGNTTVNVTLVDPVTNGTIGNASVVVTLPNGTNFTVVTDENGAVNVAVDLPVGDNNVTITYPGNETYNATNITVPVNVTKRDSTTKANVTDNVVDKVTIDVEVTDTITNKPIPNGSVTVKIKDTVVGTGEIKDGKATIPTNITPSGTYDITVIYEGNENYTSSQTVLENITVLPKDSSIEAEEVNNVVNNTIINVTLIDLETEDAIANEPIKILYNGTVIANATTDENGKISTEIDLPAGNYTLDVIFDGNSIYAGTSQELSIDIVKGTADIETNIKNNEIGNASVEAKITDTRNGEVLTNVTVELTCPDGTKISAITNDEGIVTFENLNVSAGVNELNITLVETPEYSQVSTNVTMEVDKKAVIITVDEVRGIVGENITLIAHVTDLENNPVTGGNLVFKINGKTLAVNMRFGVNGTLPYKIHVEKGIVTVTLNVYHYLLGAENITASYSGSNIYYANKSEANIANISLRNATLSVETVNIAKQNNDINFTATIKDTSIGALNNTVVDEGFVIFKINGKTLKDENNETIRVSVANNTATYTYHVPLNTGAVSSITATIKDYTVTAVYSNTNFNNQPLRNTTTYNVERKPIKFNYTSVEIKNNKLSVKADLLDDEGLRTVGTNKICVKINGKTYRENNATMYYYISDGVVDLKDIDVSGINVEEITLVSGNREAYLSTRDSTSNIVKS